MAIISKGKHGKKHIHVRKHGHAGRDIRKFFTNAWGTIKGIAGTLHKDARDIVGGGAKLVQAPTNRLFSTVDHIADKASVSVNSLGQSLSMPLLIIGAIAAIIIIPPLLKR